MKKVNLFILLLLILYLSGCGLGIGHDGDYEGFYSTKIPTDSILRGTIKIPNKWEFITEDGIIKLINKDTKKVIAEQIVQGHMNFSHKPDINYVDPVFANIDNLTFNQNINFDIKNVEKYDYIKGYSNAIEYYEFKDEEKNYVVLKFEIYDDKNLNPYYLFLFFYDKEEITLEKIINSYCFGGTLGYEKDHIYDDEYKPNQ